MAKRFFKNMKIAGKAFVVYNTSKTGILPIYRVNDKTYAKPRQKAHAGQTINGVTNLVLCKPIQIGTLKGFIEPIELSPEILTTLGFEKSGCYWVKNKVYIWEWGITNISYHTERIIHQKDDRYLIREIPYLHTLQNYFYALTGEELIINL